MTKLQRAILLKQLETCNLALKFGKLNEEKTQKILAIKTEILKRLNIK